MLQKISLSSFGLKIIATILMIMDHIYYYFSFTGKIPLFFTQLGRLSLPLFVFLLIEGFFRTKSRKKYFFKIYILASIMGVIRCVYFLTGVYKHSNAPYLINGILSAFAVLFLAMQGFEWIKQRRFAIGITAVFATIILPYFFINLINSNKIAYVISEVFLFNHFTMYDGGTFVFVIGLALYFFREHRIFQAISYVLASLSYCYYLLQTYTPNFTLQSLFTTNYQWMMVFSALIFLLYNGKKGRAGKLAFYIFYPAHVYVLWLISFFVSG